MYLWTTEAVSSGHPDKVADQIADSILDAVLALDPTARVASEVTLVRGFVLLSGEISTDAVIDFPALARQRLAKIGYDRAEHSFDSNICEIENRISQQSPEIAQAVSRSDGELGAGDQGMMFGYASDETPSLMPLAHHLAFEYIKRIEANIQQGRKGSQWLSMFRPDAKTQVTVEYNDDGTPKRVHTVVISVCHKEGVTLNDLYGYIKDAVVLPVQEKYPELFDNQTNYKINPAGLWNVGGPASDTGLSGRKIVVDNYGGDSPIGGGSFSGKDPTKVDRSGAYAARHIAKNIVAAGLAKRVTVQISYAIGIVQPISVRIQAVGSKLTDTQLTQMVVDTVDLTPKGIIERLKLRQPIYAATASGGHFGRKEFPWEATDLVQTFLTYKK